MSLHRRAWLVPLVVVFACCAAAKADDGRAQHDRDRMWQAKLAERQTLAASVVFDGNGRLWRARVQDGQVLVDASADRGASYGAPVAVNPAPEAVAADGDARPKIAVAADGTVYVSYTQLLEKPFTGHIRFSRSLDGGKSFSPPLTVNDDRDVIGHRFDALLVGADGRVHVLWLDKRDAAAAQRAGAAYAGSALYHAVSADRGASFAPNRKLADHACECCRIALALAPDGAPVALWRHVYDGNERDHALMKLDGAELPRRVSFDRWRIDACPHHGPALAIGARGDYHLAWFNNAPPARGLFYARSRDGGETLSAPLPFGAAAARASHPDVLSVGGEVLLVWKEFDGEYSVVRMQHSRDGGASWSAPRSIARTADASDHPQLVRAGDAVYLSWNTRRDGHRLIALHAEAP